ncbi:MAG: 50S ribosomal protein L2 [Candidatus Portnoybacteria bacterium RIFCSPLOWO2_12_FULL_39_9]|uniref:Large ribosomal subunit protein uL2 n=1 Tax=Candidatus Portnoybacteria bacterium RIFCSPHIGHO2_12_FULL_38_9 TaxID=1801997 RepID=A0A1G2FGT3_9BACT|nr:MAG: 50S ribosomal protein L2 [Candidatus Portnoybacteria bacterium RBG_13_40_8]OGZ36141.1 MAG: 50S ribosomal protein L2 [Candidatus Portnoybacteria bacterium RIFCSPHIGHO2_02_FULL_39_12]OGZ37283.1 MAG: 50S ribosomal protein L2 [Candidatus Portnoybacteria bacterium RIFCSPHIGHO2_12_FULL_38_9]OGZ38985.1 MAG: 50S ribosomal protein L2 [Candidatus Portnoybacteria bacterium RIFCSPLOWO2_01_FULL_38_39]OGZ40652.1 MAG: 50S ribosomal protein L2 [Candidatus Portnoybacteria bacterium RIFCSPLOWO2_12_FULL_3
MFMKYYKPTTPSRRAMTGIDYSGLNKKEPEKKLTKTLVRSAGRGHKGRITTRHKGGGHKRKYRLIDFKQTDKMNMPAKVMALEYDPNRTCFIALIEYQDKEKRYVLAPFGLAVGDEIVCQEKAPLKLGNRMQMKNILSGTQVYNIELWPGRGGQLIRSAGLSAQILANEGGYVHLKLPSGEVRMVKENCWASIGQLSNPEHNTIVIGKAGRSRWLGKRPTVRGSAMNPVDHPHGGGEGRTGIGLRRGPKTPWGKLAYGVKTRKKKKWSDKMILKRRS